MSRVYNAYVGTLKAGRVLAVIIRAAGSIEMVRRSPAGVFWCRFDGLLPEPGKHDNFVIMRSRRFVTNKRLVEVKLISETDLDISVEGSVF